MGDAKKAIDTEFILKVLRIFNGFDGPSCDAIWWRTDGEYAPVTFLVNCNDEFWWASADCERLTPENLPILERAIADCKAAVPRLGKIWASTLFVARVRGMRPQGAAYPSERALWPLFDACGPEREVDFGNPKSAPKQTDGTAT